MTEYEWEERYDEMLDDCYPPVKLTGDAEYPVSRILKLVDPILYRIGLGEFIDSMEEEENDDR